MSKWAAHFCDIFGFYEYPSCFMFLSKTYSVKFSNWDLVLDCQLDYENICIIISWKKFNHFYLRCVDLFLSKNEPFISVEIRTLQIC
jgi:hypothetical protein